MDNGDHGEMSTFKEDCFYINLYIFFHCFSHTLLNLTNGKYVLSKEMDFYMLALRILREVLGKQVGLGSRSRFAWVSV